MASILHCEEALNFFEEDDEKELLSLITEEEQQCPSPLEGSSSNNELLLMTDSSDKEKYLPYERQLNCTYYSFYNTFTVKALTEEEVKIFTLMCKGYNHETKNIEDFSFWSLLPICEGGFVEDGIKRMNLMKTNWGCYSDARKDPYNPISLKWTKLYWPECKKKQHVAKIDFITEADIPLGWFKTVADKFPEMDFYLKFRGDYFADCGYAFRCEGGKLDIVYPKEDRKASVNLFADMYPTFFRDINDGGICEHIIQCTLPEDYQDYMKKALYKL